MLSEIETKLDNQVSAINEERLKSEQNVKKLETKYKGERKENKQKEANEKQIKDNIEKLKQANIGMSWFLLYMNCIYLFKVIITLNFVILINLYAYHLQI